jgi:nucleoside-diphosphate-sugar epimerase
MPTLNNANTLLITGSAGFIGSNLVLRHLESEEPLSIVGLDNLNDYYDTSLKEYRRSFIPNRATSSCSTPTFCQVSLSWSC